MRCSEHQDHGPHVHGKNCGHTAIGHEGHIDYLHDGHLHHLHRGHVDDHRLAVGGLNPQDCKQGHQCGGHGAGHEHGPTCGHEALPHGDHVDYLVAGHLHHAHRGHCDDHGRVTAV